MESRPTPPKADRRHLQQIIAGLSDGIILIDVDREIVWANEMALAMHEARELADLGGTPAGYRKRYALRYRNNHRLQPAQYPMERVLAGDNFSDLVVQASRTDDDDFRRVYEIRSLVLSNANGQAESAVLVMKDVTDRASAEERFEKVFNANPAPALICRLSDLRYVRVNQGFLEMTGYCRDDILGRSAYEIDVLENAEEKDKVIAGLNEGKTIAQMEAQLKLPGGANKYVVVAGQPLDDGNDDCMLFTFIDLEPRKKVEEALRHSEERFSKAFRLAPVPMTVSTLQDFRLLEVNTAFIAATGYTENDVVDRHAADLELWADPKAYGKLETTLKQTNSTRNYEIQVRTKTGALVDCLISAETVTIHDQSCVLSVIQDITERKRSEVELIAAIEAVMQDTSWFSRTVIEKLAQLRRPQSQHGSAGELADLTPREREVLGLMCQGLNDEEIARTLHLSRNTVRNHVATIYSKIDVHRRSAAIVWARERGIIGYEKPARRKE